MLKLIALALLVSFLTACSFFHVHKVEVIQGNVMTSNMANRIHLGQSPAEVRSILGEPVLVNIMNHNDLSYVYTSETRGDTPVEKKLSLLFSQNRLVNIQRSGL